MYDFHVYALTQYAKMNTLQILWLIIAKMEVSPKKPLCGWLAPEHEASIRHVGHWVVTVQLDPDLVESVQHADDIPARKLER